MQTNLKLVMVLLVFAFLYAYVQLSNIPLSMGEALSMKHCSDTISSEPKIPSGLAAVMLTVGKDKATFEYSIQSALEHLKDIGKYYVITPNCEELAGEFGPQYGERVIFVGESMFPFTIKDMQILPQSNKGWYLQQLLKVVILLPVVLILII